MKVPTSPIELLGTALLFVNVAFAQDDADVQQCGVSPPTVHVTGLSDASSVRLHRQCQWHTMLKSVSTSCLMHSVEAHQCPASGRVFARIRCILSE
jgi:hypothetical protein